MLTVVYRRAGESLRSRSLAVIEFLGPVPSTAGDSGLVGSVRTHTHTHKHSPSFSLSFWVGRRDHEVAPAAKWVGGTLGGGEKLDEPPLYRERGKRYPPLYVKGTDTRATWQKRRKKRDLPFFERAEKTFDEKRREGLCGFFIPLFFFFFVG